MHSHVCVDFKNDYATVWISVLTIDGTLSAVASCYYTAEYIGT